MKAQPVIQSAPSALKRWPVRLLLVGEVAEFRDDMMLLAFDARQRVTIARSASLLGALEQMQTEPADLVLLSDSFQDEEVAVFLRRVPRVGFEGVVLRVPSATAFGSDPFPSSSAGYRNRSLHFVPMVRGLPPQDQSTNPISFLTDRQRAVLAGVSKGLTNAQVARELACTEGAVKATLQHIFKKLGVRKRAQLVRLAFERKLIDDAKQASRSYRQPNREHPLLLRSRSQARGGFHVGDFVIDIAMHRVWVRGVETHLTPTEFELLEVFAAHPGELVRNSSLRELFWRNPTAKQDSLRVLVRGLRAKIEVSKIPQYIVTERNFGYRFNPFPAPAAAAKSLI